jgi:hypothetical protein
MKKILGIGFALIAVFLVGFTYPNIKQPAQAILPEPRLLNTLCGDGSEADQYGFSYPLQQYHWTVDGEAYLSTATIDELDAIFDQLNAESVVQTMILFKPADQVGNRVNCAVHFLRYMQLGLTSGERKDNGFAFLIVVEKDKIDVHYGVGLGLPALTAYNLTEINRLAEDTYQETGSMDQAILALANSYASYAREQYPPLVAVDNQAAENNPAAGQPTEITLPALADLSITSLMCLCCISIIVLFVFLMIIRSLFRGGGGGWTSGGGGFRPSGGGFSGWSGLSGGSSGGFRPHLPTRGGGGSGRSNRGN